MSNSFVTPWTTLTSGSPIFVFGFVTIFWAITYTKYSFPLCKIKTKIVVTYRTIVSVKQDKVCKVTFLLLLFSHSVLLFSTPRTVACQAPLSMRVPRQEYWSGLPLPTLGISPPPEMEPTSPALQVDSLLLSHQGCYRA